MPKPTSTGQNNIIPFPRTNPATLSQHRPPAGNWNFGPCKVPELIQQLNSTPRRRTFVSALILLAALCSFGLTLLFNFKLLVAQAFGGSMLPEVGPNHRVLFFGIERLRSYFLAPLLAAACGLAALFGSFLDPLMGLALLIPATIFTNRFFWYWLAPGARRFVLIAENWQHDRVYDKVLVFGGHTFNQSPDLVLAPPDIIDVRFQSTTFQRIIGLSQVEVIFRVAGDVDTVVINSVCDPVFAKRLAVYIATEFRSGLVVRRREP